MKHKSKTKRSIGPAGASIVSDDGKFLKLANELKGASSDSEKLKIYKRMNNFFENIKKDTESKIKGIPSDADVNTIKRSLSSTVANTEKKFMKDGGLAEATAKLKAQGLKDGGMKIVRGTARGGGAATKGLGYNERPN